MALIYPDATISPTKPDLLAEWVPTRPWGEAGASPFGAYRFDDPDGVVGIETHLLRDEAGRVLHVPLTYRPAELAGAEAHLICTMEHSVLGRRWIYDACGDPLYVQVLASVLLGDARQALVDFERDGEPQRREPSVRVSTSGGPAVRDVPRIDTVVVSDDASNTVIETGDLRIVVRRRLDVDPPGHGGEPVLVGEWDGGPADVLLAYID